MCSRCQPHAWESNHSFIWPWCVQLNQEENNWLINSKWCLWIVGSPVAFTGCFYDDFIAPDNMQCGSYMIFPCCRGYWAGCQVWVCQKSGGMVYAVHQSGGKQNRSCAFLNNSADHTQRHRQLDCLSYSLHAEGLKVVNLWWEERTWSWSSCVRLKRKEDMKLSFSKHRIRPSIMKRRTDALHLKFEN